MDEDQTLESNQPQDSQETSPKKQFTIVTSFSKYLASVLFVVLLIFGFWFGMNYQGGESYNEKGLSNTTPTLETSDSSSPTGDDKTTVASTFVEESSWQTYQNSSTAEVYRLKVDMPESWKAIEANGGTYLYDMENKTTDGKTKLVLSIDLVDDIALDSNGYAIFENKNATSFESWIRSNFPDENSQTKLKKIIINGHEAWELPSQKSTDPCYQWTMLYHNGLIFQIYRNKDTCNYDQSLIEKVISSLSIQNQGETKAGFHIRHWSMRVESFSKTDYETPPDSLTRIPYVINNNSTSTIFNDFGEYSVGILQTTKDKNRTYFYEYSKRVECVPLYYLDIDKRQYFENDSKYCPGSYREEQIKEQLPYIVQLGKFDFINVIVLNLETGIEKVAYSKKHPSESLIARCTESGYFESIDYSPDISYPDATTIKIGVYKNVGQDSQPCTKDTLTNYEKIRDEVVDLSKL